MGGLSHTIESEGIATTHISLIREHTVVMKPPRALWVPFVLGRPFGAPNQDKFQTQVLMAVLKLLEAPSGPLLADFPKEAPIIDIQLEPVACPIQLAAPPTPDTPLEQLLTLFEHEVAQMRTWHDLACELRGRTTCGALGMPLEQTAAALVCFIRGIQKPDCLKDISQSLTLRLAAEDVKAAYFESVSAQPGQSTDNVALADWFWGETAAATVIDTLRRICLKSDDKELQSLGKLRLVPRSQLYRFKNE